MTQSLHPQVLSSSWVTSVSLDLLVSPPPALPLINSVSPSQPEIYLKNTNRSFPLLPALQWLLKALKLKSSLPNPADHNLQDLAGLTSFWFLGSAMLPLAASSCLPRPTFPAFPLWPQPRCHFFMDAHLSHPHKNPVQAGTCVHKHLVFALTQPCLTRLKLPIFLSVSCRRQLRPARQGPLSRSHSKAFGEESSGALLKA